MKTGPLPSFAAAIGAAALLISFACSRSDDSVTTVQATRPDGSTATVVVSDTNVTVDVSDGWDRIKDFAFDRRADLKARRMDLDNATSDTWADAKAKTSESLKKTKATFDKVTKANTAS